MQSRFQSRHAATAVRTRWQVIQVFPVQNDDTGQRNLRIIGYLLIATGVVSGLGDALFTLLQNFARDFWWTATAVVLVFVSKAGPLSSFLRAVGFLLLTLWFAAGLTTIVVDDITYRVDVYYLGFMFAILGLIILFTNDPRQRLRIQFQRWATLVSARRNVMLVLCVATLWVVNPAHSHSMCMAASHICERQGAFGWAITFTTLARDTFPPDSFCLTCYGQETQELSWRIVKLRARSRPALPTTHEAAEFRIHAESPKRPSSSIGPLIN